MMRPQLQAIASTQGGVFLRRQALGCGYTPQETRRLLRTKQWLKVRHGAYADREVVNQLDDVGRALLRIRAVSLVVEEPAVFTHNSSSIIQKLPTWGTDLAQIHLTRPQLHCGRIVAGVTHHEASIPAADIEETDGLACTSLSRTPLDVARQFGFDAGVVAADAALRAGGDPVRMHELAGQMRCWPDAGDVMPVVKFADGGAESPGESLARIFVVSLGFPPPETQLVISDGGFVARVDMKLRGVPLLIEFDGRMKYRRNRDDCDPTIDDGDVVWAEKQREDTLRGLGHGMFRLIWSELFGARRAEAGRRLWRLAEQYGASRPRRRPV